MLTTSARISDTVNIAKPMTQPICGIASGTRRVVLDTMRPE